MIGHSRIAQDLEAFKIPESVKMLYIGKQAFCNCSNLTNFAIPGSVERVNYRRQCIPGL